MFPEIQELEFCRLNLLAEIRGFRNNILLTGTFLIVSSLVATYFYPSILIILIVFLPVVMICMFMIPSSYGADRIKQSGFFTDFKRKVIKRMVHFFDETFFYEPTKHISMDDFKKADIFRKSQIADTITGDDLITGKIEDVGIMFSELHVVTHRVTGKRNFEYIFNGFFIIGDFNGKLKSQGTAIYERFKKGIENFEIGDKVYKSCVGSKIFIALPCDEMLEPDINRKLSNFDELIEYFEYLRFATGTIEAIIKEKSIWME